MPLITGEPPTTSSVNLRRELSVSGPVINMTERKRLLGVRGAAPCQIWRREMRRTPGYPIMMRVGQLDYATWSDPPSKLS